MSFLFSWIFFSPVLCVEVYQQVCTCTTSSISFSARFLMCWNTVLALLYPHVLKIHFYGNTKSQSKFSSQALVFVFYFLDILILQVHYYFVERKMLRPQNGSKLLSGMNLKVNVLKVWKKERKMGREGEHKNRKKNSYSPSHEFITRPSPT